MLDVRVTTLPVLPTPRAFHSGALLPDGRVVLVGGNRRSFPPPGDGVCETRTSSTREVTLVDPRVGRVEPGPRLHEARQDALVQFVVGAGLLVAGGLSDFG